MKTIMDVRVVYYTKGEDRMKLIEKYKLRLETEKGMPVLDKIANYYLLGMANSNRSIRKTRMLSIKRYVIT